MTQRTPTEQLAIDAANGRTGPLRWRMRDKVPEHRQEIVVSFDEDYGIMVGEYHAQFAIVSLFGMRVSWAHVEHWLPASELAATLPVNGGEA